MSLVKVSESLKNKEKLVLTLFLIHIGVTPKATSTSHFEKPKVVIRPAIAPKTEAKVQYVKVVGSKPIQQQVNF